MAATFTNVNYNGDPVTQTAVDTGSGSAPFDRPSTFTPPTIPVLSAANDTGSGSTVAKRATVFEPPSVTITLDPGLMISG